MINISVESSKSNVFKFRTFIIFLTKVTVQKVFLTNDKDLQIVLIDISENFTVKPVLSGHLKIDKTKVLMVNGNLMKVERIAECSHWSILQYF